MRKKKTRKYYFVDGSISVGRERPKLGNIILWMDPSVLDEKELFCGWIHQCWNEKKLVIIILWVDPSVLDEKEKKLMNILWVDPSVEEKKNSEIICGWIHQCWMRKARKYYSVD